MEATSSLTDGALSSNLPTSPSSSSSVSHLSCRGLILVIWWGGLVVISTSSLSLSSSTGHLSCRGLVAVVVQWGPPHRHPWVFCPVEALSPSLSSGGLLVVIRGSFVLWRPRPHHCRCRSLPHCRCPVGASSSLPVLADRPCCVVIVVVVR